MSSKHHQQYEQQLQEIAATFISEVSNRRSLITITRTVLHEKNNMVTFYISVFPEDAEGPALGFLMRKRGECHERIKKNARSRRAPHVEFVIDEGDKNRRRVEELLHK